jgi:hypothetical protein
MRGNRREGENVAAATGEGDGCLSDGSLCVGATYVKVGQNGRIVSVMVIIVVGVNRHGLARRC